MTLFVILGLVALVALREGALDWLGSWPGGSDLAGRVTHVRDGDTIEVGGVPVRIANLDCAKLGTVVGERARERMRALAGGEAVACALEGRRSFDREVGTCELASSGEDLGERLLAEGVCARWWP